MDVAELIAEWQASLPGSAWQSDAITPDQGSLASWMEKMLQTSGGLKLTRSADPFDRALRYLAAEGVDVERELAAVDRAREAEKHRVRAAADDAEGVAIALKRAERELLHESRGFSGGAVGFTSATLREAEARVARLTAELTAACCDDPVLARSVRRSVA